MKWLAPLILLTLAGTANAQSMPNTGGVRTDGSGVRDPAATPARNCRDTVHTVRAERGLPLLRENAAPADEPEALLILAVDREIEGCDVLVMANDLRDVRPLAPMPDESDWRVRPAQ